MRRLALQSAASEMQIGAEFEVLLQQKQGAQALAAMKALDAIELKTAN